MYFGNFPDGTISVRKLPPDVYAELMLHVSSDGYLNDTVGPVHGNYVNFSTYKVKVKKVKISDTIYKVQLI